jgi:MscS family membrane protein
LDAAATTAHQSDTVLVARTDSPRQTLQSWLSLTRELAARVQEYRKDQTRANLNRIIALENPVFAHLDLSQVAEASRRGTADAASSALFDILGRVDLPPMESVPDSDAFDESAPGKWRLPRTPITIARIDEGPRAGEFLFSARTVATAPSFYERIRHLPLRRPSPVEYWTETLPQLHGPMIPVTLVEALPDSLKKSVLDTPIWKILLSGAALGLAAILLVFWHLRIRRRLSKSRVAILIGKMLTPLAAIVLALVLGLFFHLEVNLAGSFAWLVYSTLSVVKYLAFAWLFWLAVLAAFEWMILSPRIPDESLNASLMRLSARFIGFLGVLLFLALGAHDLGVPVLGVVAGLGFGGLAIALAVRPTLENLVGGVILFVDKPVRVGDFCSFGNRTGTVENIGIRSTKIRALDRTLISIPNAAFADMELVNWAHCDTMLILAQIGLRYETEPDQLRQLLASLREMLYAHPKIDRSTVRVRYVGYGASSRDVQIRVHALTQEWNEFYAIREDVFLRVDQIVADSGTSFAFPSQTLYLGRDDGLDRELSEAAKQQVADWRRRGALPFPGPAAARIDDLAGTLDYPPRGSVEERRSDAGETQESERLSESPPPDQSEDDAIIDKR